MRVGPSPGDVHEIVLVLAPDGTVPASEFLDSVPLSIAARIRAVAVAVAEAPPTRFAGGGYWEAMHDEMSGWFEIRVTGSPRRTHYRVFCLLDLVPDPGLGLGVEQRPRLVLVDGRSKPFRTVLDDSEYEAVRALGDFYRSTWPRPVA